MSTAELDLNGSYDNGISQESPNNTMAASFRGRSTAKSTEDLKRARETRAVEALKMKDEQLRILSEQNASLLTSLEKVLNFSSINDVSFYHNIY